MLTYSKREQYIILKKVVEDNFILQINVPNMLGKTMLQWRIYRMFINLLKKNTDW